MNKYFVIFIALFIATDTRAQRTIFPKESIPKALFKKNEISINISPLKNFLLSAPQQQTRYAISYKRFLDPKSAIRTSIGIDYVNSNSSYQHMPKNTIIRSSYKESSKMPFISVGYERYFGDRKLSFFYGADLIIGYYRSKKSSTGNNIFNDSIATLISMKSEEVTTENIFKVGISPFIGAKYSFSKTLAVSCQMGYNFIYQSGQRTITNKAGSQTNRVSSFNVEKEPGFFSNISLIHKF